MTEDPTLTRIRGSALELPGVAFVLREPGGRAERVELGIEPLVIGTDADASLVTLDRSVSKRHCELYLTETGVRIRDLGSKNGTFVNGVRVFDGLLALGSSLAIGQSVGTLELDGNTRLWPLSPGVTFGELIGASVPMRALFGRLERLAATDQTVLVYGETGTGKELVARALHERGSRAERPMVVLDCSALTSSMVEAELFGHARGAFTGALNARAGLFEDADGGTLFIDEIGELPLEMQPRLLRALERGEVRRVGETTYRSVNARIVAATHRDLRAQVRAGTFREDLYFRLAVGQVRLPPLREHKDDIPVLIERFLSQCIPPRRIEDLPINVVSLLEAHGWPGNVRELRNTVSRLLLFPEEAIETLLASESTAGESGENPLLNLPLRDARELVVNRFEERYLRAKIARAAGNLTRAAAEMGVSRQFLYRLLAEHGIARNNLSEPPS